MAEIRLAGTKTSLFTLPDLEIDEFVPVVQFDSANSKSDALVTSLKGPKVELSPVIDEPLRTIETDILVAVPGKMVVTCTVAKGRKGTLDEDGIITPRLVGEVQGVTVEAMNSGRARYGEAYRFTVEIVGSAERAFKVELLANDDAQDANSGEFKDVLCGCVEVRTWPDVFSESDASRLLDEMNFIAPFAEARSPSEYSGNYCMNAADRGLSRLLGNIVDFYSVDRNHARLNKISFTKMNASSRAKDLHKSGFVSLHIEFEDFKVDHALRESTKTESDRMKNVYDIITYSSEPALELMVARGIEGKPGFHVYYISVSDDYHTLLLLIDGREPGAEYYTILDQYGNTSSSGPLGEIGKGIARQTSWTHLSYYMDPKNAGKKYPKWTFRAWKIRRNP